MSEPVQLSVRSQLSQIIAELEKVRDKSDEVSQTFKEMGPKAEESLQKSTKRTEVFFNDLRNLGRRAADQLKDDFRSLLSMNAISDALKISNQFRGSIKQSIELGDNIRKLGPTFNVATQDFARFQNKLTKGLGQIGLSSEVASKTLEGLAGTPVRGEANVLGYARTSGQLASITKQQGQEGSIAAGIANVIRARGGNVNDLSQMGKVAEDLRRVFLQTGRGPTETLSSMEQLFAGMSKDFRATVSTRGLANLAASSQVAGPNATKFLEEYLGTSPLARLAFEAQGGKGIFNEQGIDVEKFGKFSKGILGRIGNDPRMAAQTLGLSEDAAEGFIRLAESLDRVKAAQDGVTKASGSVEQQFKQSRGLMEAFQGSINRVKGIFAGPGSYVQQKSTQLLTSASESNTGALATVAGAGVLASLLAGFGLRGIGKGLGGVGGTLLRGGAAESITGQKTVPVYVTNAAEIGGGGMGGAFLGAGGKRALGVLGKGALIGATAYAGYKIGGVLNDQINQNTRGRTSEGFEGNVVQALLFKLDMLTNGLISGTSRADWNRALAARIHVTTDEGLKSTTQPRRGASIGP